MKKGLVEVYCGTGKGKSTLALGQSVRACAQGKSVIIIQFLKGKESSELEFIEDLSPLDLKIFRFEKSKIYYENLSEQEKAEEKKSILNGLNFAKKVDRTFVALRRRNSQSVWSCPNPYCSLTCSS